MYFNLTEKWEYEHMYIGTSNTGKKEKSYTESNIRGNGNVKNRRRYNYCYVYAVDGVRSNCRCSSCYWSSWLKKKLNSTACNR